MKEVNSGYVQAVIIRAAGLEKEKQIAFARTLLQALGLEECHRYCRDLLSHRKVSDALYPQIIQGVIVLLEAIAEHDIKPAKNGPLETLIALTQASGNECVGEDSCLANTVSLRAVWSLCSLAENGLKRAKEAVKIIASSRQLSKQQMAIIAQQVCKSPSEYSELQGSMLKLALQSSCWSIEDVRCWQAILMLGMPNGQRFPVQKLFAFWSGLSFEEHRSWHEEVIKLLALGLGKRCVREHIIVYGEYALQNASAESLELADQAFGMLVAYLEEEDIFAALFGERSKLWSSSCEELKLQVLKRAIDCFLKGTDGEYRSLLEDSLNDALRTVVLEGRGVAGNKRSIYLISSWVKDTPICQAFFANCLLKGAKALHVFSVAVLGSSADSNPKIRALLLGIAQQDGSLGDTALTVLADICGRRNEMMPLVNLLLSMDKTERACLLLASLALHNKMALVRLLGMLDSVGRVESKIVESVAIAILNSGSARSLFVKALKDQPTSNQVCSFCLAVTEAALSLAKGEVIFLKAQQDLRAMLMSFAVRKSGEDCGVEIVMQAICGHSIENTMLTLRVRALNLLATV